MEEFYFIFSIQFSIELFPCLLQLFYIFILIKFSFKFYKNQEINII